MTTLERPAVPTPRDTSKAWKRLRDVQWLQVNPELLAYVREQTDLDEATRERICGILEAHASDLEPSMAHLLSVVLRMARLGHLGQS